MVSCSCHTEWETQTSSWIYLLFHSPMNNNVKFFAHIWRWCIILTNFMRINKRVDKKWGINPANMFSHLYFMYKRFTLLVFTLLLAATKNVYTGVAWLQPAPTSSRDGKYLFRCKYYFSKTFSPLNETKWDYFNYKHWQYWVDNWIFNIFTNHL